MHLKILLYFLYFKLFCAFRSISTENWLFEWILAQCQLEKKAKTLKIIVSNFHNFLSSQLLQTCKSTQPKLESCQNCTTVEDWRFEYFPDFPSGVRYMLGKIRDQATFFIFFQNFLGSLTTPKRTCKMADVFPSKIRILS